MGQQQIKLYQGSVSECSYLPGKRAINIYADPHHPEQRLLYNQLIGRGFRRSGEYIYRPGCIDCSACVPVRVLCDEFTPSRGDRRNLRGNGDLEVDLVPARYTQEYHELYSRYLAARHPGGGMDNPDSEDFQRFLLNPWGETLFLEVRRDRQLLAVAVTDATADGLSAVYTFFEPDESRRGLGRFCILRQIVLCQQLQIPYLYLGYWVEGCQKMAYKVNYRPQEQYIDERWQRR
ncbi:MAG: arginyltransferase [Gammaproteobacteria bacterium]|nr:MAG: arginyltransferase [Gammaproteobacteria bacterium]